MTTLPDIKDRHSLEAGRDTQQATGVAGHFNRHMDRLGWPLEARVTEYPQPTRYQHSYLTVVDTETGDTYRGSSFTKVDYSRLVGMVDMLAVIPDFTDYRLWPVFLDVYEQGHSDGYNQAY